MPPASQEPLPSLETMDVDARPEEISMPKLEELIKPSAPPPALPAVGHMILPAVGPAILTAVGPTILPAVGPAILTAVGPTTLPAVGPTTLPAVATLGETSIGVNSIEQTLLKELEEMGFMETQLNREILRANDYDLEKALNEICGSSEWDPILEELQEMVGKAF